MADQEKEIKDVDPYKPYKGRLESYDHLPEKGRDPDAVLADLSTMAKEENAKWKNGKVSGTLYHAGETHRAYLNKAFSLFSHVNTLQFDLCPSMSKMESEIIAMTARMLHGDAVKEVNPAHAVCGTVTSGGSESILMAMKTYRDHARGEKKHHGPRNHHAAYGPPGI